MSDMEITIALHTVGLVFAAIAGWLHGNNKGLEEVIRARKDHIEYLIKLIEKAEAKNECE